MALALSDKYLHWNLKLHVLCASELFSPLPYLPFTSMQCEPAENTDGSDELKY